MNKTRKKNLKIIRNLIIRRLRDNGIKANVFNTVIENTPECLSVTVKGVTGKIVKVNGIPKDYIEFPTRRVYL